MWAGWKRPVLSTPNLLDDIKEGRICMVINTLTHGSDATRDGFKIRRSTVEHAIPLPDQPGYGPGPGTCHRGHAASSRGERGGSAGSEIGVNYDCCI